MRNIWILPPSKDYKIIIFHYDNSHYYHFCSISKDFFKPYSSKGDIKLKELKLHANLMIVLKTNQFQNEIKSISKRTSAWVFSCKFSAYLRTPVLRTPLMDCFWSLLFLQQIMKENSITDFSICFCFVKYSPCRRLYNIQIVLWKTISWLFSLFLSWFS